MRKSQREGLESGRDELRADLERVRLQAEEDRQTVQSIAIQFESRRSSKESAAQNLQRMQGQLGQFASREVEIREQLEQRREPLAESKTVLAGQLERRVEVESEMIAARRRMEEVGLVQGYHDTLSTGIWPSEDVLPDELKR